jgi:putative Mg2+ transporter-C (MgtC) family protein
MDVISELFSIYPLTWLGVACSLLSGVVMGTERQMLGKPVGIRTSALICLGTYAFVAISFAVANEHTDNSRVIGQVVTGIGFLGAGVMFNREGIVLGVTSASAIWMLAAIGVLIGAGYEMIGVKLAILAVLVLVGVDVLEKSFLVLRRGVHRK